MTIIPRVRVLRGAYQAILASEEDHLIATADRSHASREDALNDLPELMRAYQHERANPDCEHCDGFQFEGQVLHGPKCVILAREESQFAKKTYPAMVDDA